MKKLLLVSSLTILAATMNAQDFTTQGDGTTYTLESLSAIAESGVTKDGNVYTMLSNVTIAAGDKFELDNGATLKLGGGILLRIEGEADLDVTDRALVTRNAETDVPKGIGYYVEDGSGSATVRNVDFEYCSLRDGTAAMEIENCTFRYATSALSSSGALSLSENGGTCTVTNCTFEENEVPAIGGGANVACGLVVDNCTFYDNNTANSNRPQINVTVGGDNDIVIKNSTLTGNKRTMVGAISVANIFGMIEGTNNVLIENCEIRDHRYGITTNGTLNAVIKDNRIISNKYETNAMNGGSGISIYDSGQAQTVMISGNYIEDSLWGITIIGGYNINCGKTDDPTAEDYNPGGNVFVNNGNNGELFDLYNNGTSTVYAQGNKWNVAEQTAEEIEKVITHKADIAELGEVIYMPPMTDEGGISSAEQETGNAYFDQIGKRIIADAADGTTVELYTLNGQLAATYSIAGGTAELGELSQGIYIAKINIEGKFIAIKCVL